MRRIAVLAILAILAAAAIGCSELDQTAQYKNGQYRGKPDTRPWDNAPLADVPGTWDKGERTSWEKQIKARMQSQNESRRIGD